MDKLVGRRLGLHAFDLEVVSRVGMKHQAPEELSNPKKRETNEAILDEVLLLLKIDKTEK